MATAAFLGKDALVLERAQRPGGLAVTNEQDGFRFDVTGHWLHMRDPGIKDRFGALAGMTQIPRRSRIWTRGRRVAYPYQSNLKDLPPEVVVECVLGAMEAHIRRTKGVPEPEGFEAFVLHHFGEAISREFMFPYNTKLWGVPPSDISHAWCQRFVPIPDFKQIVLGALTDENEKAGYNATFSYPAAGGIGTFSDAVARQVPQVRFGAEVAAVSPAERWVELSSGERFSYRHLVSTMPLDVLIKRCIGAPKAVADAGAALRCTSLRYFDLGLDRKVMSGLHWLYVPDQGLLPYRIGCYSNACPAMAPEGCSSLYVELACGVELDDDRALDQALEVLSAVGEHVDRSNVKVCTARTIQHAYVVYDKSYERCRKTALDYVTGMGIRSIGRYGKWVYEAMEDALIDGRRTAEEILKGRS